MLALYGQHSPERLVSRERRGCEGPASSPASHNLYDQTRVLLHVDSLWMLLEHLSPTSAAAGARTAARCTCKLSMSRAQGRPTRPWRLHCR